jgi:integrase
MTHALFVAALVIAPRMAVAAAQREQGPSSHVFMTERDGPMTPKAFHALFGRIGTRAKMPFPVHPHMLRHGCGYALANVLLVIDVTTDASEADLEKVKADLHRFCPISKVVRNSGTELEEVWNVRRP